MLANGMQIKGHQTEVWKPSPRFYNLPFPGSLKKWLGYIDQFIIFPFEVKRRLKKKDSSIFVFTDNALGMWVPMVAHKAHVIHCHDFLALHSAMGKITENKVSWTGRKYQNLIKKGLVKGMNFISVSHKTRDDLHKMLVAEPKVSEVVYNGLNKIYKPMDSVALRVELTKEFNIEMNNGFLMHLGGNLWYKNRKGVVEIYIAWRKLTGLELPLILIGEKVSDDIDALILNSGYKEDIHVLSGLNDHSVHRFYACASLFLFPSLEEGFGWPIAEAMACGCPVMTTNEAPMNEVGAVAAYYIPRRPVVEAKAEEWSLNAASLVERVLQLPVADYQNKKNEGLQNVRRFDLETNLDKMEAIYQKIYSEG